MRGEDLKIWGFDFILDWTYISTKWDLKWQRIVSHLNVSSKVPGLLEFSSRAKKKYDAHWINFKGTMSDNIKLYFNVS